MPELPEVESARLRLQRWLKGHRVVGAEADATRIMPSELREAFSRLHGRLLKADRRGKHLLLTFEKDQGLYSHLGMTGKWVRRPEGGPANYSRARLKLEDGTILHYTDPRLFGRLEPLPAAQLGDKVADLGLDPLSDHLDGEALQGALGKSRQALKIALMDQGRVAGLGNIHAAEALFRAGLHPARKPQELSAAEWDHLAEAIRATIAFGMEEQTGEEPRYLEEPGTPNVFQVYGRAKTPCIRCGTTVRALVQGGRTTHFCPHCQPLKPSRGRAKP
jgi:formamidopyrimidine-DNA glycosylase